MPRQKKSTYRKILDVRVIPKLVDLGFVEVSLERCMRPEVLFRKGDLWFGTSWDSRDRYLDLDIGGLYWMQDVRARVVVLGNYADHCPAIKRIVPDSSSYLEGIAENISRTLEGVVGAPAEIQASEARGAARLRPILIGRVRDDELAKYWT